VNVYNNNNTTSDDVQYWFWILFFVTMYLELVGWLRLERTLLLRKCHLGRTLESLLKWYTRLRCSVELLTSTIERPSDTRPHKIRIKTYFSRRGVNTFFATIPSSRTISPEWLCLVELYKCKCIKFNRPTRILTRSGSSVVYFSKSRSTVFFFFNFLQ